MQINNIIDVKMCIEALFLHKTYSHSDYSNNICYLKNEDLNLSRHAKPTTGSYCFYSKDRMIEIG